MRGIGSMRRDVKEKKKGVRKSASWNTDTEIIMVITVMIKMLRKS